MGGARGRPPPLAEMQPPPGSQRTWDPCLGNAALQGHDLQVDVKLPDLDLLPARGHDRLHGMSLLRKGAGTQDHTGRCQYLTAPPLAASASRKDRWFSLMQGLERDSRWPSAERGALPLRNQSNQRQIHDAAHLDSGPFGTTRADVEGVPVCARAWSSERMGRMLPIARVMLNNNKSCLAQSPYPLHSAPNQDLVTQGTRIRMGAFV